MRLRKAYPENPCTLVLGSVNYNNGATCLAITVRAADRSVGEQWFRRQGIVRRIKDFDDRYLIVRELGDYRVTPHKKLRYANEKRLL